MIGIRGNGMSRARAVAIGFVACALVLMLLRLTSPSLLSEHSFSKVFWDREGHLLRLTLSGDEKFRVRTRLQDIDPKVVEAFLLQEDRYFFWHPGVNPVALFKVFMEAARGARMRGASTLTMQLVRLKSGYPTRSVFAKSRQILAAIGMELRYSKNEILEAYLNLAPFGANIEGVEAASLIYFSKPAARLHLSEVLALALIPQSPSRRGLDRGSDSLADWKTRREQLFTKWKERYPEARERDIELDLPLVSRRLKELPFRAPHLTQRLERSYASRSHFRLTLDLGKQTFLEGRIRDYVSRKRSLGVSNASVMLVNYVSGDVLAYVGSADFFDDQIHGQVDGVVARRSPGSSLKPFVYALALEQGLIHTQTLLKDTPKTFGAFDPENFDKDYLGALSAEESLVRSRNIPAVDLSARIRDPSLYEFLKGQGFALHRDPSHYGLGVALGGAESSLEELTRLYAGLARGHALAELSYLKSTAPREGSWPLSRESAWIALQMLSRNPRDSEAAFLKWTETRLEAAWKTGTSSGFRDAWTVGVFGPYVLGVWLGNFSGESNPAFVGRQLAAPLFFEIAEGLARTESLDGALWSRPARALNVKRSEVCSVSGAEPHAFCPHRKWAWIIPGKSPIARCDVHRSVLVDTRTGKRTCGGATDPSHYRAEVFEFWPSDLHESFRRLGIHKTRPPEMDAACDDNGMRVRQSPPEIVLPRREVVYALRLSDPEEKRRLPFQATADGNVRRLDWFVGSKYLGSSRPGETFYWVATRGQHLVTVVDDSGTSQSQQLEVKWVP